MKLTINKTVFHICIICHRLLPSHKTSILFYDGIEPVRVCTD